VYVGLVIAAGERLTGWVAASRQAVIDSDASLDFEGSSEHASPDLQRCASVPLMLGTSLVGVLSVYSAAGACDQNRGRLLEMIAPHVAAALRAAGAASSRGLDSAARSAGESSGARDGRLASIH
jgi:GAF domain-containing protein